MLKDVLFLVAWEDQTGPDTLIKYMTDGMLLREILSDDQVISRCCRCLLVERGSKSHGIWKRFAWDGDGEDPLMW